MAGFGEDLRLFAEKVERRSRDVFVGTVTEVHRSITAGSEVTGAPGQPVDTGHLIDSWIPSFPAEWIGEVATIAEYAVAIEEGGVEAHQRGPYTRTDGTSVKRHHVRAYKFAQPYRSGGGPHSVALTRTNWDRVVEHTVREVVR